MFSVEAAGQVYKQTNELYLGGDVNHNAGLSIEVDRRIRNAWCSFRKYTLELYDRPSAPLELKIRMLRAEALETMLYDCVTWSPRACHYDTLRRAHQRRVCRCHDVFLWCYLCFVLLRFRLYVFVEAAALRSTVLRYAGAPIATHTCFFLFSFLLIWRCRVFRVFFVPLPFFLCMESTSYVLSSRLVFFYLVTRGWNSDISLIFENSINQSMMTVRNIFRRRESISFPPKVEGWYS